MTFQAKYPGTCHLCGTNYERGDWLHYVHNKVCHESCHLTNGSDFARDRSGEYEMRKPQYTVRGRREHEKRCDICFLTHAGECP